LNRAPSLIVVSAPSGTGKSTVLATVLRQLPELRFSVSHTTRRPRAAERDGVSYHFVERARFEEMARTGQFLEWAQVHGELYGTSRAEQERARSAGLDLLLDVDVQGAAQVRARTAEAVTVFLLPPSRQALEARLRGRAADEAEAIARRLAAARDEVARYREYDYVLVNRDPDECARTLGAIIEAARHRTRVLGDAVAEVVRSFEI
jgi:guanylate kinase